jgi:hypothetical protein
MKTPLIALFLLAPLFPPALGSDKSDCPSSSSTLAEKTTAAPATAKPATSPATTTHAPAATTSAPVDAKPRRTLDARRPAYLFM